MVYGSYLVIPGGLMAAARGIYSLFVRSVGMDHFVYKGFSINIDLAIRAIKIGIHCAKNGHWDEKEDFTCNINVFSGKKMVKKWFSKFFKKGKKR